MSAKDPKKPQPRSAFASIQIPSATDPTPVSVDSGGLTTVQVVLPNDPVPADTVFVKVYATAPSSLPAQPPTSDNTVVQLTRIGTSNVFESDKVPVAAAKLAAASGGAPNNTVVAWPQIQGTYKDPDSVDFLAQCQATPVVKVPATACIWFTWTLEDVLTAGPANLSGEKGDGYRPIPLIRPSDATSLVLSAATDPPGSMWAHLNATSGPDASGPEGIADTRKLENAAYQSAALLSDTIVEMQADGSPVPPPSPVPVAVRLNRLIGLWGTNYATRAAVIDVGQGRTFAAGDMPNGATCLFLAFHDGHEWSNNVGQVQVTATWS